MSWQPPPHAIMNRIGIVLIGAGCLLFESDAFQTPCAAQMILAETPLTNVSDSFYESNNIGFSFSIPGSDTLVGLDPNGQPTSDGSIRFSFGGPGTAIPPFGGFDPNSGTRFGFAFLGKSGGSLGFNFGLNQGSDRTVTHTNPFIVIPNGGRGTVIDTIQRPFVTSFVPVLGAGELGPGELGPGPAAGQGGAAPRRRNRPRRRTISSSATTGDLSVAQIKLRKKHKKEAEIDALLAKAREADAAGKTATAKIHFRSAARRATGDLRREILEELERLIHGE
jgi:hypothetical protein